MMSTVTMRKRIRSDFRYWFVITLPPLLVIALLLSGAVRNWQLGHWSQVELNRLADEGRPVDVHSLTRKLDETTSKQNAQAWQEIIAGTVHLRNEYWPLDGMVLEADQLVPKQTPWKAEPLVSEYVLKAQPIVEMIAALKESDQAVWQPTVNVYSNHWWPFFNDYQAVSRLLTMEFRVSFHAGNTDRALRALSLIDRTKSAINIVYPTTYLLLDLEKQQEILIRQSLAYDFWTEEQLTLIQNRAEGMFFSEMRWHNSIDDEQAYLFDTFADAAKQPYNSGESPAFIAECLMLSRKAQDIPGIGTLEHIEKIAKLERESVLGRNRFFWASITEVPFVISREKLMPSYGGKLQPFITQQMDRNLTNTAIGIKQFRLKFGRFPGVLSDPSQVGLTSNEWTILNSQATGAKSLGYKVAADLSEAILWTVPPYKGIDSSSAPSEQPPSELAQFADMIQQMEVRIR